MAELGRIVATFLGPRVTKRGQTRRFPITSAPHSKRLRGRFPHPAGTYADRL